MSGEYFPTPEEWALWFSKRKEEAIKLYMSRPKFTINRSTSRRHEEKAIFRELPDDISVAQAVERFVGWEKSGKQNYQFYMAQRYYKLFELLTGQYD